MKNNNGDKALSIHYPFFVWVTSICLAPVLYIITLIVPHFNGDLSAFILLPYIIGLGAVLSLPSLLLFYFAFKDFTNYNISNLLKKLLLTLVAIACLYITFLFLSWPTGYDFSDHLFTVYSISIIASGLFYNLYKKNTDLTAE